MLVLAVTTAIGGGIARDLIIGNTPPLAFRHPIYITIAIVSTIGVWIFYRYLFRLTNVILIFDAIGLAVFTANGARIAFASDYASLSMTVSLGVLTGTGGGILRDIFVQEIPMVFRKEIYATASIFGVLAQYYSRNFLHGNLPLYICFATTLLIRLVAMNFNMNLPTPKIDNKDVHNNF